MSLNPPLDLLLLEELQLVFLHVEKMKTVLKVNVFAKQDIQFRMENAHKKKLQELQNSQFHFSLCFLLFCIEFLIFKR
jgi:hypothetical protein